MSAAQLLARILAEPDDHETRLVYADAIADDDPARSELIVVETRLIDVAGDERDQLLQLRAQLLAANSQRWWPELPAHQVITEGGFVRGLHLDGSVAAARLTRLAMREPITALVITGGIPVPAAIAFMRVRHVELHGPMDPRDLAVWFRAAPANLDTLAIRSAYADDEPAALLRADAPAPAARRLLLDGFPVSPTPILEGFQGWPLVEELGFAYSAVTDDDLQLLATRDVPRLQVLRLSGTRVRRTGLLALAEALTTMPALARLELLDVRLPALESPALQTLAEACRARRITFVRALPSPDSTRLVLDNRHLELRTDGDEHRVYVDGVNSTFMLRERAADGVTNTYVRHAPLGELVQSLARSTPLRWNHGATRAWVPVSRSSSWMLAFESGQLVLARRGG